MVDSAERKKRSKACGTYKFTLIKTIKKCKRYGTTSTVRRWKKIYPHINESTVSGFKDQIGKKKSSKTGITSKLPERPCLFRNKINPLIQKYLKGTKYKGGVVNTKVAIVTAKALTKRFPTILN